MLYYKTVSVILQVGLRQTWSESKLLIFSCEGSKYFQECGPGSRVFQESRGVLQHGPVGHGLP